MIPKILKQINVVAIKGKAKFFSVKLSWTNWKFVAKKGKRKEKGIYFNIYNMNNNWFKEDQTRKHKSWNCNTLEQKTGEYNECWDSDEISYTEKKSNKKNWLIWTSLKIKTSVYEMISVRK